jgi:VWFA-related protein
MNRPRCRRAATGAATALALILLSAVDSPAGRQSASLSAQAQHPVFGSGVDLVVVHATVTDQNGYFVAGLQAHDFELEEDGRPQPVSAFSSERVPVSIGLALDLSNSMKGDKLRSAKGALSRLLDALPDPEDEIFLYGFGDTPSLLQTWTSDRALLRKAIVRATAGGLTALYDATASAVSLAATGRHVKKALVLVSDGTDTASHTDVRDLRRQIRESDLLVYAIGIDAAVGAKPEAPGTAFEELRRRSPDRPPTDAALGGVSADQRRGQPPVFPPRPPGPAGPAKPPLGPGVTGPPPPRAPIPYGTAPVQGGDADAAALRDLTRDSGGRTVIIRSANDLPPATAGIADELGRQYFLGYQGAAARDGRWHTIEVAVSRPGVRVRARTGYFAGK